MAKLAIALFVCLLGMAVGNHLEKCQAVKNGFKGDLSMKNTNINTFLIRYFIFIKTT